MSLEPRKESNQNLSLVSQGVAHTATLPTTSEWSTLKEICTISVQSGLIPQKNVAQAVTIALKGRELSIPPMTAFAHICVINGKPSCSAELQLALIYRRFPNAKITFIESTDKVCTIEATRPGEEVFRLSFSIEEAKKAELLNKDSWRKYPAAMLRARAISAMARAKFPDALCGMSHTPEELGADVDDDGNVVDVVSPAKPLPERPVEVIIEKVSEDIDQKNLPPQKTGADERSGSSSSATGAIGKEEAGGVAFTSISRPTHDNNGGTAKPPATSESRNYVNKDKPPVGSHTFTIKREMLSKHGAAQQIFLFENEVYSIWYRPTDSELRDLARLLNITHVNNFKSYLGRSIVAVVSETPKGARVVTKVMSEDEAKRMNEDIPF